MNLLVHEFWMGHTIIVLAADEDAARRMVGEKYDMPEDEFTDELNLTLHYCGPVEPGVFVGRGGPIRLSDLARWEAKQ